MNKDKIDKAIEILQCNANYTESGSMYETAVLAIKALKFCKDLYDTDTEFEWTDDWYFIGRNSRLKELQDKMEVSLGDKNGEISKNSRN